MGMDYEEAMDRMKDAADAEAQDHAAREEYEADCRERGARLAELTRANADLRESLAASEATVARLVGERDRQDAEDQAVHANYMSTLERYLGRAPESLPDGIDELAKQRDAESSLAESRRLALDEAYEAAEQWHHSVEWEWQEYTGKVMAICAAALNTNSYTALAELKRSVRVEALRVLRRKLSPQWTWCQVADFITDEADRIAAGTEVEDAKQ